MAGEAATAGEAQNQAEARDAEAMEVCMPAASLGACSARVVAANAPPRPHLVCTVCRATWRSAWWENTLMEEHEHQKQTQMQL